MKDALYLGIDGGQSGTRILIVNGAGEIVGQAQTDKTSFVLAPGGKEQLRVTLEAGLQRALPTRKFRFRSAFLGLSGVIKGGETEEAVRTVCGSLFTAEKLDVDTDASIAWAGALELRPGIIVIAGSGSIALGVDGTGCSARAGGWGYLFGDEGGSFGIAKECLKRVLASIDHNRPIDSLIGLYTDFFGGIRPEQLVKDFYAGKISRDDLARITPELAQLALQGDRHAQDVFFDAAEHLASLVVAVSVKLQWSGKEIEWSPVGGVFRSGELLLRPMCEYLNRTGRGFKLVLPKFPPVVGAVLLALRQVGDFQPILAERIAAQLR